MVRRLLLLLGLLIAEPAMAQPEQILSAAFAPDPLARLDPAMPSSFDASEVQITVRTDHITIYGLTSNRGNCKIYAAYAINGATTQSTFPFSLNFGDQLTADMVCRPIEVEAQTDHGAINIALKR